MSKILLLPREPRHGAATAKLAASRGYDVAVNYVRDAKAADAWSPRSRPPAAGRRDPGDMAKEADVARVFA